MKNQARNFLYIYATQLFVNAISILFNFIIGKNLSPENLGMFRYILSIGPLAIAIASFGIDVRTTQDVAEEKMELNHIASAMIPTKLLGLPFILMFMMLIVLFGSYSYKGLTVVFVLGIGIWFQSLVDVGDSIFKGLQKMGKSSIIQLLRRTGEMCFAILLFLIIPSVVNLSFGFLIGNLLAVLVSYLMIRRYINLNDVTFKIRNSIGLIKRSFPYYMANVLQFLNFLVIPMILDITGKNSQKQQGLYQAAWLFSSIAFTPKMSLVAVIFPAMVTLYRKDKNSYLATTNKYLNLFWLIAVPFFIGMLIIPEQAVRFFLNDEYLDAAPIIGILGVGVIFSYLLEIPAWHLTVSGYQVDRTKVITIMSVLTPIFSFFLIKNYGGFGAGLSMLLSLICQWVLYTYYAYKRGWRFIPSRNFLMTLVVCFVVISCTYMVKDLNLFIGLIVLCLSFLLGIFIFRPIPIQMIFKSLIPVRLLNSL